MLGGGFDLEFFFSIYAQSISSIYRSIRTQYGPHHNLKCYTIFKLLCFAIGQWGCPLSVHWYAIVYP